MTRKQREELPDLRDDDMPWLTDAKSVEEALGMPVVVEAQYSVEDTEEADIPVDDTAEIEGSTPIDPEFEEYLITEYKSAIQQTNSAIETLQTEVNGEGATPRTHEVYGGLVETKLKALQQLTNLRFGKKRLSLAEEKAKADIRQRDTKLDIEKNRAVKGTGEGGDGAGVGDTGGRIAMTAEQLAELARNMLTDRPVLVEAEIEGG